jgi:CRP-like cAMP-binding protein
MTIPTALRNCLLDAMTSAELAQWSPELEFVAMPAGFTLHHAHRPQRHAYFPIDAVVSLQCVMSDGSAGETAIVGNEGVVGISIFMGGDSTPGRAVVKSGGSGYRVGASVLRREFARGGALMHLMLLYTQALLTQMSQTVVCNRHHSIDEQICRGLLLSLDSTRASQFSMTHELIANSLGVRRESITEGAGRLQKAGLIRYGRGRISVIDRQGLEERCCECYSVIQGEYRRLLPMRGKTPRSPLSVAPLHANAILA